MGTHFLWNPINDNIVKEFDDAGNTIADYTTEPSLYGDLVSQHRDGQSSFYHYDGQGSTTSLTDSSANVTDTYAYSAFGGATAHTGSTINPFQYIGRRGYYNDIDTGGIEVRRRSLSQILGRWISQDPMHVAVLNGSVYVYSLNSPTYYIDPEGLITVSPNTPDSGSSGPKIVDTEYTSITDTAGNEWEIEIEGTWRAAQSAKDLFFDAKTKAQSTLEIRNRFIPNPASSATIGQVKLAVDKNGKMQVIHTHPRTGEIECNSSIYILDNPPDNPNINSPGVNSGNYSHGRKPSRGGGNPIVTGAFYDFIETFETGDSLSSGFYIVGANTTGATRGWQSFLEIKWSMSTSFAPNAEYVDFTVTGTTKSHKAKGFKNFNKALAVFQAARDSACNCDLREQLGKSVKQGWLE